MKPNSFFVIVSALFVWVLIGSTAISFYAPESSSRPPAGYTGATGNYCSSCHGGAAALNQPGGSIVAAGLPTSTFDASGVYDFSLTINHSAANRLRWGFSIIAVNSVGAVVGTFSSSNPNAATNGSELSHLSAVSTGAQQSFTYTNLRWTAPANVTGNNQTIRFYFVGNAANGTGTSSGDFIYSGMLQASAAAGPNISTPVPADLSGFSYNFGSGPSVAQSFTVSATGLSSALNIAAPNNYEVSLSSGSGFSNSISITPTSGNVATTQVFVRLNQGLPIGNYSGSINISSMGAVSKTVSLSGVVNPGPVCDNNTWTGAVSTAWENPANWSCGSVPGANTNVTVNSPAPRYPVINSNAVCRKITLSPDISLIINTGFRLDVTGTD